MYLNVKVCTKSCDYHFWVPMWVPMWVHLKVHYTICVEPLEKYLFWLMLQGVPTFMGSDF